MPLPPGQEKYGRLQGERLKVFVDEITGVSRKSRDDGELLWGRIAGTKYDDMVETLVEEKFKAWGLQSHRRVLRPAAAVVPHVVGVPRDRRGKDVEFKTVRPARGRQRPRERHRPRGDLGRSRPRRPTSRTEMSKENSPSCTASRRRVWLAIQPVEMTQWSGLSDGAAAVLLNIAIPGNVQVATGGSSDVPTFTIGTEDMAAFQALMNQGTVKVRLQLGVERRAGLRDANVWGILPGTTDEDIIVMAHHDGYFESALDNASGMSVVLGLARYLLEGPAVATSPDAEVCDDLWPPCGSLGVRWMHDNKATFLAKTALAMNAEHVSAIQIHWDRFGPGLRRSNNISARRWFLNGSDKLAAIVLNAYKNFGVTIYEDMDPIASGDMGSIERDVPSLQLIESALYYHTDQDRPDYVPAAGLEAVARAYAKIIDDVNQLQRAELVPGPYVTPSRRTTSLP